MTISREDKELLERLVKRSADPDGLDRKTLREIDQEGWGIKKKEYNYFAKTSPLTEQALAFARKYLAKGKSVLKGRV